MTTRATLRAQVRSELNDGGAVPLWPDERLNQWLAEAVRDYGRSLPREATATLASVADQAAYALPADTLRVVRVEHPQGVVRVVGGDGVDVAGYEVFSAQLVLAPAPHASGESIALRYLARYAEPATDGEALATPAEDDQVLAWYACWRALGWISADEARRQRFERQRGATAAGEAQRYQQLYQAAIDQRRRPVRSFRLAILDC
ncbi:MAG: hypothetical protein HY690_18535 [Chloroflexi bacterium]|nr:hypothetical protein [Chloroflexota bacterium]